MTGIINRNIHLYGPGPSARRMAGLASAPPLRSLVIIASQGFAISIALGVAWKYTLGNNDIKIFEDYYKANPP
jgi:hypothetical protein